MTMAISSTRRTRKPLFSEKIIVGIKHRLRELGGIAFLVSGIGTVILLITYNNSDPSYRSATNLPAVNFLGSFGSHIADPVHLALGASSFSLPLIILAWGWRLLTGKGSNRIFSRLVFFPFPIAAFSIFGATNTPPMEWSYLYGLGGIFGDAALTFFINSFSIDINIFLKLLSVGIGISSLLLFGYVCGVNNKETKKIIKFLYLGLADSAKNSFLMLAYILGHFTKHLTIRHIFSLIKNNYLGKAQTEPPFTSRTLNHPEVAGQFPKLGGINNEGLVSSQKIKADDHNISTETQNENTQFNSNFTTSNSQTIKKDAIGSKVQYPQKKVIKISSDAKEEEQPSLSFDQVVSNTYSKPRLSLLQNVVNDVCNNFSDDALNENARMLENVLDDYGVKGEIISVKPGPVVTLYELEPAAGLKASRVISLSDDIARSMSALAARVSTIPGRSVIGIELPNDSREKVFLKEIFSSQAYGDSKFQLPLALGKDIGGEPIVANLAKMPHLLIAGTTGSGKSVGINTMILSLLYRLTPEQCRIIMIDPKMLELSVYDGIPHLLSPVVTDPKKAVVALKWAVAEMEERYRNMSKMGVRNIDGYNQKVDEALLKGESFDRKVQIGFDKETGEPEFETQSFKPERLPYIVIIVDEMADLMMVAGKDIEACIQRLAQMARAAGIHLIMATQRPSVDVITGTIKANFPTRISFQVTSKIDSRTILGEMGAEQLLGMGDMLYMANGGKITRVHGPFVSDEEVEEIVKHLKMQGAPNYVSTVVEGPDLDVQARVDKALGLTNSDSENDNSLYDHAIAIVARDRKCSTSYIQRKLSIGYNKAAKIVEQMEESGAVSQANHVGKREILLPEIQ